MAKYFGQIVSTIAVQRSVNNFNSTELYNIIHIMVWQGYIFSLTQTLYLFSLADGTSVSW